MRNLSDHLGQILAELTQARMQSDLEAVRVADLYASHALLRHFPVPRFRIAKVTVDVPVAVRSEPETSPKKGAEPAKTTRSALVDVLRSQWEKNQHMADARSKNPQLTERAETALEAVARRQSSSLPLSAVAVVDEAVNAIRRELSAAELDEAAREQFIEGFQVAASAAMAKLAPKPEHLRVVTDSAELREIGPAEVLTRIQLSIVEEGMEWKQGEAHGRTTPRLFPE